MKTKICKKCNIEKNVTEFHKNKRMKDGLHGHCKVCKKKYDSKYRKTDKIKQYYQSEEYKDKKLIYRNKNYIKIKLKELKINAKRRDIEFSITEKDIHFPTHCPLLGEKLNYTYGKGYKTSFTPSFDRIDNSKGYIPGNVWVISRLANQMKSSANFKQLITFSTNILKQFKDDKHNSNNVAYPHNNTNYKT